MLAQGGFGTVHLAWQLELNRKVVVKLLHADVLADKEQVQRFLTEAKITAAISEPHVVTLIDAGVDGEVPWIAYEFLEGGTLRDLLHGGCRRCRLRGLSLRCPHP